MGAGTSRAKVRGEGHCGQREQQVPRPRGRESQCVSRAGRHLEGQEGSEWRGDPHITLFLISYGKEFRFFASHIKTSQAFCRYFFFFNVFLFIVWLHWLFAMLRELSL